VRAREKARHQAFISGARELSLLWPTAADMLARIGHCPQTVADMGELIALQLDNVRDRRTVRWLRHFYRLIEHRYTQGDLRPDKHSELGIWVKGQRINRAAKNNEPASEMDVIRWDLMDTLGFEFDPNSNDDQANLREIRAFYRLRQCVPGTLIPRPLHGKMTRLRNRYRTGTLSPEIVREYDAFGFEWENKYTMRHVAVRKHLPVPTEYRDKRVDAHALTPGDIQSFRESLDRLRG